MGNTNSSIAYTIPIFVCFLPAPSVYYPPGKKVYCVDSTKLHKIIDSVDPRRFDDFTRLRTNPSRSKMVDQNIYIDEPNYDYEYLGTYRITAQLQGAVFLMQPEVVKKVYEQLKDEQYFCTLDENMKRNLNICACEGFYDYGINLGGGRFYTDVKIEANPFLLLTQK